MSPDRYVLIQLSIFRYGFDGLQPCPRGNEFASQQVRLCFQVIY
jgi:hypothetical protein